MLASGLASERNTSRNNLPFQKNEREEDPIKIKHNYSNLRSLPVQLYML